VLAFDAVGVRRRRHHGRQLPRLHRAYLTGSLAVVWQI
jgi:hypothetical protein